MYEFPEKGTICLIKFLKIVTKSMIPTLICRDGCRVLMNVNLFAVKIQPANRFSLFGWIISGGKYRIF